MRGAQTRLGLARLRLDTAGRSGGGWGTLEAATCLPQRQDLSSRTLRKKGERSRKASGAATSKEKKTPRPALSLIRDLPKCSFWARSAGFPN